VMHLPRCIDPQSQTGPPPEFEPAGSCRLGQEGHCRKCPHRGQDDPRRDMIARAGGYAPGSDHYDEASYTIRPDTEWPGGRTMDEAVADFLWPPHERGWLERDGRWAERAAYHLAVAEQELVRELLREIFDLRAALASYRE
jgi:hypothetical protein